MPLVKDEAIAELLRSVQSVALLGSSNRPARPSYGVMRFLLEQGYRVFPVNPRLAGTALLGRTVYSSLADIPERVDMVDVFRDPTFLPEIVDETIRSGIPALWTQLDVVDFSAAERAELRWQITQLNEPGAPQYRHIQTK